jgi:hypothetical protein
MEYGTKVLKKTLKRIRNMTVEDYEILYREAVQDVKENNIHKHNAEVILDVSKSTLQNSDK